LKGTDVLKKPATFIIRDGRWRLQVPLKLPYPSTKLYGVISHKPMIFNFMREDFESYSQYSTYIGTYIADEKHKTNSVTGRGSP
jgi:hypothetical protein